MQILASRLRALQSFKKIRTGSRDSLFYTAAIFGHQDKGDQATQALKSAIRLSNVSIQKFADSQPFEDQNRNRELQEILESVGGVSA